MSKDFSPDSLKNTITKRYVIALSIIATLSMLAFYMLFLVLKDSESIAYVVNISGKQRMLSQHIALDVHKIYQLRQEKNKEHEEAIEQRLEALCDEMLEANRMLSSGELSSTKKIALSDKIRELYFGSKKVAQRVEAYALSAKELGRIKEPKAARELLKMIAHESEPLLADLNAVVLQYQKEGEERLVEIQHLEGIIFVMTLFTLLLEVIFIFQPLVRHIVELSKDNALLLSDLQHQVEIRTMYLESANKRLDMLANHDPLTGLLNRLNLEKDLDALIAHFEHNRAPFAVLIFDIDWFKDVNDTYGHDVGDTVLQSIAHLLKENFRESDKLYRTGGEEFVALLSRIELDDTLILAHKIRKVIERHLFSSKEYSFYKTISVGVYHTDIAFDTNYKKILKYADMALYRAKDNGRNRVEVALKEQESETKSVQKFGQFIFRDLTLQEVIDVDSEAASILGYSPQEFLSQKREFCSIIYSHDCDLIDAIELPFSKTLRVIKADGSITIVRVTIEERNERTFLKLYDAKSLASGVRDGLLVYNFNSMLENTNDFIYFKDANHVFTGASKTLVDITSVDSRQELIGTIDYDVFDAAYADEYYKLEKAVFSGEVSVAQEYQPFVAKDGQKGWVDNRKYPIKDNEGNIIGLFGIARVLSDDFKEAVIPPELKERWES